MRHGLLVVIAAAAQVVASTLLGDPPERVGRLNLISGAVSYRPASVTDWTPAEPNRTLTIGDALWTDVDSRAEVHVGSTAVRLAPQTELDFLNLDDETLQASVAVGTATVRVRYLGDGQVYELDTPNGAVSLASAGEYRIDVANDGGSSRVTVWSGLAQVTAAGSSFEVRDRQVATITGTDAPTFDLDDAAPYDEWDNWCLARDRREDNARSWRYVSREMPGWEDLDEYGRWTFVAGYGNVWSPTDVPPGWAPYHTGHWVWTEPWGWTWVDEAPWGFAPYHYGRWAFFAGRWMWCPRAHGVRTVVERPVFAPALVAFIGGPGWRLSFSIGDVGAVAWVPLGPGEVYRPAYPVSTTYLQQVNVTNVTNITVINNTTVNNVSITNYRNAAVPGAVVAMPQNAMSIGQPVGRIAIPLTRQQLTAAPLATFAPAVAPTKQALVATLSAAHAHAGAPIATPPPAIVNRHVMAMVAPPPLALPFAVQQKALAASPRRPLSPQVQAQLVQAEGLHGVVTEPVVKSAVVRSGGVGLKPVRPGLAETRVLAPTTPNGFVSREVAVRHTFATGKLAPTAAVTTGTGQSGPIGTTGQIRRGVGVTTTTILPTPTPLPFRRVVTEPVHTFAPPPTPAPTRAVMQHVVTRAVHTPPPPPTPRSGGGATVFHPSGQAPVPHPPTPTPVPTKHVVTQQVRRGPGATPTPKKE